jgi:hypothetical protein
VSRSSSLHEKAERYLHCNLTPDKSADHRACPDGSHIEEHKKNFLNGAVDFH